MLEFINVKKSYHAKAVLLLDSLSLGKGIYQLRGANGAGKTTLLKMIAGLLPFDGDIVYENISQKKNPVNYRRHISWAEAEPLYPSFLKGSDLLDLYCDLRKIKKNEAGNLVRIFNMMHYIDEPIGTYSAGMTKKLSLLLAFTGLPSVCLLDEPFISLDEDSVRLTANFILEEYARKAATVIISSHHETDFSGFRAHRNLFIINQHISFETF